MKKTLVAIAALASVSVFAQTTVSLTGLMDGAFVSYNLKGNRVQDVTGSSASGTTAVIFAGSEDLGAGAKMVFQYEIDPNIAQTSSRTAGTTATGTTSNVTTSLGNGQSFVGLSGSAGTIRFGTPNTSTLSAQGEANSGFGTAIGSGYRVSSFDAVRFQSSLKYDTPTASGFSASYLLVPKNSLQSNSGTVGLTGNLQNQTNGRDQVTEVAGMYADGPLTARIATLQTTQWAKVNQSAAGDAFVSYTWSAAGTGGKFTLNTVSASYKATPQLTVGALYQTIASDTLNNASATSTTIKYDRKTTGLSAAYEITPVVKLMTNYAVAKNGSTASNSGTASKSTTVMGLGVDYALSKRSTAFIRYENNGDEAGLRSITGYSAVNSSTTYTATAVGLRHTF